MCAVYLCVTAVCSVFVCDCVCSVFVCDCVCSVFVCDCVCSVFVCDCCEGIAYESTLLSIHMESLNFIASQSSCVCVCVCPGKPRARAGEEPGDLGVLRTKLLRFLSTSKHYVAAEHITSFPPDGTLYCLVFL